MSIINNVNSGLPELHSFCDMDPEVIDFCNKTYSKLVEEKEIAEQERDRALEERNCAIAEKDEMQQERDKAIDKFKECKKMYNCLKDKYIYALEISLGSR